LAKKAPKGGEDESSVKGGVGEKHWGGGKKQGVLTELCDFFSARNRERGGFDRGRDIVKKVQKYKVDLGTVCLRI